MAGGNWDPVQIIPELDTSSLRRAVGSYWPSWQTRRRSGSTLGLSSRARVAPRPTTDREGSGAFAVAGHWIANVELVPDRGTFLPGPAVGIALVYWISTSSSNGYLWWSEDPIELQ